MIKISQLPLPLIFSYGLLLDLSAHGGKGKRNVRVSYVFPTIYEFTEVVEMNFQHTKRIY